MGFFKRIFGSWRRGGWKGGLERGWGRVGEVFGEGFGKGWGGFRLKNPIIVPRLFTLC